MPALANDWRDRQLSRMADTGIILPFDALLAAPLPAELQAPFVKVNAWEDAWDASVDAAQVRLARDPADTGRLAMAVRGVGRIRDLRVEPLDLYRHVMPNKRT